MIAQRGRLGDFEAELGKVGWTLDKVNTPKRTPEINTLSSDTVLY